MYAAVIFDMHCKPIVLENDYSNIGNIHLQIVTCKGLVMPNNVCFLICFSGFSGEIGRAIMFFNSGETSQARIPMVIPNSLDLPQKHTLYQKGTI